MASSLAREQYPWRHDPLRVDRALDAVISAISSPGFLRRKLEVFTHTLELNAAYPRQWRHAVSGLRRAAGQSRPAGGPSQATSKFATECTIAARLSDSGEHLWPVWTDAHAATIFEE